jgi:hypothetical protein
MPKVSLDAEQVELTKGFTIRDYRAAVLDEKKESIAAAMQRRFRERYIEPVRVAGHKHGFTMMAVACLMMEALESFRNGTRETKDPGGETFEAFFENSARFPELKTFGQAFTKTSGAEFCTQAGLPHFVGRGSEGVLHFQSESESTVTGDA